MASTLDLAGLLRSLSRDDLAVRVGERVVSRPAQVRDAFDLAEALLEPASVREALSRLDRVGLLLVQAAREPGDAAALLERAAPAFSVGAEQATAALERAAERLVLRLDPATGEASTFDAVGAVLDDDPALSLATLAGVLPPAVLEAVAPIGHGSQEQRGTERLYALVVEMAEIVRALEASPARELAKGGLALPESRRLAEAARIDVDDVMVLLGAAQNAGLARQGRDGWEPGPSADDWLALSWADRWSSIVDAWLASVRPEVRTVLDERAETSWREPLRAFTDWFFPAGSAWVPERLAVFAHTADLFGLTVEGRPTGVAAALLRGGREAARDLVAELMPSPITTVYLQHDLTAVAPGPLAPALDARLRSIADVESAGLAATYRISEAKLQSALIEGETAESLRDFLTGLSSTGIPQPVDYLLRETAQRHGRYRVAPFAPGSSPRTGDDEAVRFGAVSRLRADDPAYLDMVEVDQSLGPLGLRRLGPTTMVSRFDPETVYWALSEARYPIVVEGADGSPLRPPARRVPRRSAQPSTAPDARADMLDRVAEASGAGSDDTDRAWIARQLDAAVKARLTVVVTVAMPDGTTTELQMEPTGVGGGRVRGRDRKSDIERTLPLSSIVAVETPPR
ncbi:helicase-associated domain-containing protein [Frondihabitans australicus]|uniref:XPB/Ssl2-like helicase family protein n=1 Tax=Frondihabitans australicus TaxID=386892 RepID=A0A495IH28_9MICO|nr:helicase-associated domain-containing protein [Frondihabitans australicus]RKR75313.1 XPB/Ssl2-like helicase family protein [Frondihabitans australicus]